MKIQADTEGVKAVKELCNMVLRTIGLEVHEFVGKILTGLEEVKEPPKNKEPEKEES